MAAVATAIIRVRQGTARRPGAAPMPPPPLRHRPGCARSGAGPSIPPTAERAALGARHRSGNKMRASKPQLS